MNLSTVFYPQTDCKFKKTIQTLEEIMRTYILEFRGNWDDILPLVEFIYNNSYQTTIDIALYETMYGRKYHTPICWNEVSEKKLLGS